MSEQGRDTESIFHEARRIPDSVQRADFLAMACAGDDALRTRVEKLLAAEAELGSFLGSNDETRDAPSNARRSSAPAVTTIASPLSERPGTIIGRYKLLQQIGEGGFGVVYMAEQEQPVRRKVALKIIKLGMDTRQVIARFEAERQALAMMDHPHIAKVLDAGATDTGRPYFVMELVKGMPITDYCDKENVSLRDRLSLFMQVCSAVQHAHQKGIIHRDLKPNNILVTLHDGKPVPKVIDFGIAKATEQKLTERTMFTEFGQFMGTPAYMSPEQAEMSGLDIDTRSDIYSMGVVLYELLTGATPFDVRTLRDAALDEIRRIIREVEPSKPSTRLSTVREELATVAKRRGVEPQKLGTILRGDLDWIVMKALEKDRQRRYESATGLGTDIGRYLSGEAVLAAPPSKAYRLKKFVRRNRAAVAAGSLIGISLIVGMTGTSLTARWAMREKVIADAARDAEREARQAETAAKEDALRQSEIAREVNEFLTRDLLSAVNPTRTQNRQITVREVVDMAALRIGHRFASAPVIGASIEATLGELYYRLGELESAQKHMERAYELFRSTLGETDRSTLEVRGGLDDLLCVMGRNEEGIKAAEESIKVMLFVLGPDDPVTLNNQTRLGTMCLKRSLYDRADTILRDTWERQKRVIGPSHRDTLGTLNNLALSYMEQQKFELALPLLEEVVAAHATTLSDQDPDAILVALNLGWTHAELGKLEKAEEITAKILENARKILGNDHYITQSAVNNLGVLYRRQGRLDLAEPLYVEGLEVTRRTLGPDHPDLLPSLHNLGKLYYQQKKYAEAEPLLAESVEKGRRLLAKDDVQLGMLIHGYAECLIALHRPQEGVTLLLEAHDIMAPVFKPDHRGIQQLYGALVKAYEDIGNTAAATEWKAKIAQRGEKPEKKE